MLKCSGIAVVGSVDSGSDMLSWLLLIMFFCWYLGIWVWDNNRYSDDLSLSLLDLSFISWFLFPYWSSGQSGLWLSRKSFPSGGWDKATRRVWDWKYGGQATKLS